MTKSIYKSFIRPTNEEQNVPCKDQVLPKNIMERFYLTNKVSVITGAGGTIGAAIAEGYAQAGSQVAIIDIHEKLGFCEYLTATYKIQCKFYCVDIRDADAVEKTILQIETDFGTIDVFVANAGVAWNFGSILNENSTAEAWKKYLT